jgi:hypothetical protein
VSSIGRSLPRLEDERLLTGRSAFAESGMRSQAF